MSGNPHPEEYVPAAVGGCAVPGPSPANVPGSPYGMTNVDPAGPPRDQFIRWAPYLGACPETLPKWLCWIHYGLCSFNKFGEIGSSQQMSNVLAFPDPAFGMAVGVDAQSAGVFFPVQWVAEAAFHGIYRVKVKFVVQLIDTGMTAEEIIRYMFDNMDFRILQLGTEDIYHTALDFGEAQDAERSDLIPSQGGFYLRYPFVPFVLDPSVFAWDLRGQAPGNPDPPDADEYEVVASYRSYWTPVCGEGAPRPLNWTRGWRRVV